MENKINIIQNLNKMININEINIETKKDEKRIVISNVACGQSHCSTVGNRVCMPHKTNQLGKKPPQNYPFFPKTQKAKTK